ncbi:GlcNAc-PI de-N-acetylase [Microbacterium sp. SLBN-146]|nr:GlcNAc-PI de-N-acetylase [Microbacterium sp. SLBN-146]
MGIVAAMAVGILLVSACAPDRMAEERVPEAYATKSPTAVPIVEPEVTPEPEPTHGLCDQGTLVAIWAHYDDDLIFGHSRVSDALQEGWCVTVAYLSAGDAGRGVEYSQGREQGIRNAYDALRGYSGDWSENTDVLNTGVTVEEWQPVDDPRLLLLSFRLVDGNIDGSGFASMGYESLAKLAAGDIPTVRDVDGPEQLTIDDITHSLVEILTDAGPDQILTGMPAEAGELADGDHSDHRTAASFARAAWRSMDVDPAIVSLAIGYQTQNYPVNVEGDVLERKVSAFSAYAIQDPVTANCRDLDSCLNLRLFGAWLQREYSKTAAELNLP